LIKSYKRNHLKFRSSFGFFILGLLVELDFKWIDWNSIRLITRINGFVLAIYRLNNVFWYKLILAVLMQLIISIYRIINSLHQKKPVVCKLSNKPYSKPGGMCINDIMHSNINIIAIGELKTLV